jgi:hypothetical protein
MILFHASLMKTKTTKSEAKAFRNRWEIVNAEERKQLRRTSIGRKLQQLNELSVWGAFFAPNTLRAREVDSVRSRWSQLYRLYHR